MDVKDRLSSCSCAADAEIWQEGEKMAKSDSDFILGFMTSLSELDKPFSK